MSQIVAIIVALDLNNAIGKNNDLLCYLPNDLKHFKSVTSGHTIIMGRKTFDSLPKGALPNRRNIVITRNANFKAENVETATSLIKALELSKEDEFVYIIGGGSIYNEAIRKVNTMWITQIQHKFEGADTFFPNVDWKQWNEASSDSYHADDKNPYAYKITLFEKNDK